VKELKKKKFVIAMTQIRNSLLGLFVTVLICLLPLHAAAGTVIFSDNFNSENAGVGALNYTGFANWSVTDGTVDLIGNGYFDFYPGHGLYVDLDGSTSNAGLFSSPLNLDPGVYELQFALGGSARGQTEVVTVNLAGVYNETFTLLSIDPLSLVTRTITVNAPITGTLNFSDNSNDNVGAILDDVKLTMVPEPQTILLICFGLLGLAGFSTRRKK
jgi:hypothetical protein